jgi:intein/homing endonuclease
LIFGILSGILRLMGNTVGSKFVFRTTEDFYILGLWLADGYWRSSSIGLTSVNPKLIDKFNKFLLRVAPSHPIKKRIYEVREGNKRKQTAFQVYINNRPLTRMFMATKTGVLNVPSDKLLAYLAGRIDGDGHIDTKHRSGIRIAYSSNDDAKRDQQMFGDTNVSLYQYKAAGTYVLYLKKHYRERISKEIKRFSIKICPVETELL